jgi:hypothetical protein
MPDTPAPFTPQPSASHHHKKTTGIAASTQGDLDGSNSLAEHGSRARNAADIADAKVRS